MPTSAPSFLEHPVEQSVTISGATTAYWVYGDETAQRTLVMIHGFRGTHEGLALIASSLARGSGAPVRVIVPDLPGFGASDALTVPEGRTGADALPSLSQWLCDFWRTLGLDDGKDILLGHSFGSIVVAAAIARGLTPRALILINPISTPALRGPKRAATAVARAYYALAAALPAPLGDELLRNSLIVRAMSELMAKTRDPQLRSWIHDQHHRYFSIFASRSSLVASFTASVRHTVAEFASSLTMPVLMLVGEKDDITRLVDQRAFAATLRHPALVVYPGVGHLIHYEAATAAAADIDRFVRAVESDVARRVPLGS